MNDPNGLVWFKGKYHAFFQHYPYAPRWGQMHWGHAVSDDLINWEEKPIALWPDQPYEDDGGCFSGSAIVVGERLYLFYTSVSHELQQTQSVAWTDDGETFTKYEGNPIIRNTPFGNNKEFRDPKVFRYGDSYRMIVGAGNNNEAKLLLYSSEDLLHWKYINELLSSPDYGICAECPDLFRLEDKWVMMFSSLRALPHRICFATGQFDGTDFTPDYPIKSVHGEIIPSDDPFFPIEVGPDFYAPQTFEAPDGRRILIAWMFNWSRKVGSGQKQVGAFTIPRQLELGMNEELLMLPVDEIMGRTVGDSRFVSYENGLLRIIFEGKTVFERHYKEEPDILVLEDVGVVEVFVNGGRENITAYIC